MWVPPPQLQGHHQAREQVASNGSVFQVLGSGKGFRGAGNEIQSLGRVDDTGGGPKMHAQVLFHLWADDVAWQRDSVFRGLLLPTHPNPGGCIYITRILSVFEDRMLTGKGGLNQPESKMATSLTTDNL